MVKSARMESSSLPNWFGARHLPAPYGCGRMRVPGAKRSDPPLAKMKPDGLPYVNPLHLIGTTSTPIQPPRVEPVPSTFCETRPHRSRKKRVLLRVLRARSQETASSCVVCSCVVGLVSGESLESNTTHHSEALNTDSFMEACLENI